jgi:hypothetical protein
MLAHPARGLPAPSAIEIEGGTDSNDDGNLKLGPVFIHPPFLLGCTQANPQNVRFGRMNERQNLVVFFDGNRPEGRRIRSMVRS